MADRAMQALYLLALDPIAETTGDPNSYGFRTGRSTADAIGQCYQALAKRDRARWVLEGDIRSCFDRISHDWLLAHVPLDRAILRTWLKAGFMDQQVYHRTDEGTPQGGVISPVLANLALDGLERRLRQAFPRCVQRDGRKQATHVTLIRYADDFIITGRSREQLAQEVLPLVRAFMQERGLELSAEKTVVTHIEDGFDFLGQHVRKYAGKLLITPSKDSVKAHLAKVRGIIKANPQAPAGRLIAQLNPVIRGWARYHRHVVSKDTFSSVDNAIFQALWRWAKRRHPKKGARWVRQKYFRSSGDRHWVFSGEHHGQARRLFSAASVPIRRHAKIRGEANPYDPAWEAYFEHRLGVKMEATLAGRRTLLFLWKRQGGRCPRCGQPITSLTGWHSHHVIWRSRGGPDTALNRHLLHPTCHRQLHALGNSAVPPRLARGVREGLS
jgi:RNA-directed DNA polymerase